MTVDAMLDDIERARAAFLAVVRAFDNTTARRPIGPGRWSPLEYLEHVVRAEEATVWRMFTAVEDFRSRGASLANATPDASIEEIIERTWHGDVQAPPLAMPALGGSVAYWALRLEANAGLVRASATLVAEPELDYVAYAHPISGPFTMRQGLAFIRFHLDRHRAHLLATSPD